MIYHLKLRSYIFRFSHSVYICAYMRLSLFGILTNVIANVLIGLENKKNVDVGL